MANELTRVNRGYDSMPRDTYGSPEDDDDPHQYGEYGTGRSSQDLDRKRRKRVFSNRTKTGCMTCRRRKKKCDEQHPECKYLSISAYLEICMFFSSPFKRHSYLLINQAIQFP